MLNNSISGGFNGLIKMMPKISAIRVFGTTPLQMSHMWAGLRCVAKAGQPLFLDWYSNLPLQLSEYKNAALYVYVDCDS
jgi:hypothetical protein